MEEGFRENIRVGVQYIEAWLRGRGAVPIYNMMEDAATAEISRSQVWQWIRSAKGVLDDGRKISEDLVRAMIPDELEKVKEVTGGGPTYDQAARIFVDMSTSADFAEFLTLPLYERV